MAYKIVQSWLPSSKYNLKAPCALKPKYITIHNTWNDEAAENEVNYMKLNNSANSFPCSDR